MGCLRLDILAQETNKAELKIIGSENELTQKNTAQKEHSYIKARYYSPWIAKFISVDPKAMKYNYQSPYVYAENDPIGKIDINGEGTGNTKKSGGGGGKGSGSSGGTGGKGNAGAKTQVHTVESGETLSGIAKANHTTVEALRKANNLDPSNDRNLQVGTKLSIPSSGTKGNNNNSLNSALPNTYNTMPAMSTNVSILITALPDKTTKSSSTPWMKTASSQLGVKEATGHNDGPAVEGYLKTVNLGKGNPWCSAFVNWVMEKDKIKGTNSGLAYSWKSWGQKLDKPAYGAIAIMNYSHVAFVAGTNKDGRIVLLGGNQGRPGSVNLSPNPTNKVVSYRYPAGYKPNYNLPSYNLKGRSLNFKSTH